MASSVAMNGMLTLKIAVEDPEFASTMDTSDIPDGKWVYNSAWEYEWDEEPREVREKYDRTF